MMSQWPHNTRSLIRWLADAQHAPWKSAYEARVREALDAVGIRNESLERSVFRLPSEFIADVLFLKHASERAVLDQPIRVDGLERVRELRSTGRGLILGCSNFGCFYQSLLACRGIIDDLLIVIGTVTDGDRSFTERLERLSGARIRLLPVAPSSSVAIARQLKRGGVVSTMLDACLPQSQVLIAPFLGRPAASPSGIYQLASRLNAVVLPLFCLRRREGLEIELSQPIDTTDMTDVEIATAVNSCVETKILSEPHQWMMWPALLDRWRAAELAPSPWSRSMGLRSGMP